MSNYITFSWDNIDYTTNENKNINTFNSMITDLTKLRWRKNLYYVSENVIFEISSKPAKEDHDNCATYLINLDESPDEIKNAETGAVLNVAEYPEVFAENAVYIALRFVDKNDSDAEMLKYYPLQSIIEDGDKIVDGIAKQAHPAIYADADENNFANKFNTLVIEHIKTLMKNRVLFNPKNTTFVMNNLPTWLTSNADDELEMTEKYINEHFAKGDKYNRIDATLNVEEDETIYVYTDAIIGVGTPPSGWYVPINIWNKNVVYDAIKAIYAEKIINSYANEVNLNDETKYLSEESMNAIAEAIKNITLSDTESAEIKTLLNTIYANHECSEVKFESKATDAYTYWEWTKDQTSETPDDEEPVDPTEADGPNNG